MSRQTTFTETKEKIDWKYFNVMQIVCILKCVQIFLLAHYLKYRFVAYIPAKRSSTLAIVNYSMLLSSFTMRCMPGQSTLTEKNASKFYLTLHFLQSQTWENLKPYLLNPFLHVLQGYQQIELTFPGIVSVPESVFPGISVEFSGSLIEPPQDWCRVTDWFEAVNCS